MNKVTRDIAAWLNISIEHAALVQEELGMYWGIDFSEATNEELKASAKMAYAEMKMHAAFA